VGDERPYDRRATGCAVHHCPVQVPPGVALSSQSKRLRKDHVSGPVCVYSPGSRGGYGGPEPQALMLLDPGRCLFLFLLALAAATWSLASTANNHWNLRYPRPPSLSEILKEALKSHSR
jgi:hypothetical protein